MFKKRTLYCRSTGSGRPPEKVAHRVGYSFEDERSHGRPFGALDQARSERPWRVNARRYGRISNSDEAGCHCEGTGVGRRVAPEARNALMARWEPRRTFRV